MTIPDVWKGHLDLIRQVADVNKIDPVNTYIQMRRFGRHIIPVVDFSPLGIVGMSRAQDGYKLFVEALNGEDEEAIEKARKRFNLATGLSADDIYARVKELSPES